MVQGRIPRVLLNGASAYRLLSAYRPITNLNPNTHLNPSLNHKYNFTVLHKSYTPLATVNRRIQRMTSNVKHATMFERL